jgi:hypothetical protein
MPPEVSPAPKLILTKSAIYRRVTQRFRQDQLTRTGRTELILRKVAIFKIKLDTFLKINAFGADVEAAGSGGGWSGLADHIRRGLVRTQPAPGGLTHAAVLGPLPEYNFADQVGRDPVRISRVGPR